MNERCLVRCLTSPTLVRLYSIMNLVVWGTVVVLSQGVLPVLHGCAGVIISLEGIFAAASKNEDSIRLFMVLMLLNLVFCLIMGPLTVTGKYSECYSCAANNTVDSAESLLEVTDNSSDVCANSPFCALAFTLYGWILIVFGGILQLPIFLLTVGFYFSISRSPQRKQNELRSTLERDVAPRTETLDDEDFVAVLAPPSTILFRAEDVIPLAVSRLFHGRGTSSKDVWNTDPDATFFNSDLSYL